MSIIETKFRKGFVETPELRTDNIEYLGIDYPLYDVVNKTFVPNPTQYEEEFSNSSSFQEKEFDVIRILPHTPLLENVGLITLKGVSLHSTQRAGELEYIVLCVFAKRGQSYEFLGHSTNSFINPTRETFIDFDFDLKLFTEIDGVQMPYREIYFRPLIVQLDENGSFVVRDELKNWDNLDDRTRLKLKACGTTNVNFNPYITNLDGNYSPHVIFKYTTGSYTANDKIAHTLNGDVHLNSKDRETIEELHELGKRVFNEDDFVIHDTVIDTRELNSAYNRRGAEIMCAFTVDPKDFVGKFITELRFRRGDTKYKFQNKYLQADCYDRNNNLVGTHWSIEPKSQVSEDNGETIFNFADFIVREEYNSIEFKISTSNTTRQESYFSFCGSSLRNSSNAGYRAKDGWVLKWIDGAPEDNIRDNGEIIPPSTRNNLTPDFSIVFSKEVLIKGSGMINHVANTNIHVTADDKTEISKITPLKTLVDGHIGDASHLTEIQKTAIAKVGTLETSLNNHVSNNTIHVTQTEKTEIAKVTNIQSNIEELETKYNNVTTILNNSLPDIETFSTMDSGNYKISASGKCNSTGFQLSREHFTTGSIKVVEICHIDGKNADDIRLCAIVFNHGENENTPKTLDDCIFSVNTQTQIQGVAGSMCFRFNNLELPDDYEFVRFLFAKGDTVIPAHNNSETVIEARIQILARNVDGNVFIESPDDECKVMSISSTFNWYPYVRVMKTVLGYSDIVSLLNRISALESRVSELENS